MTFDLSGFEWDEPISGTPLSFVTDTLFYRGRMTTH